jgi:hypothetical protein
MMNKIVVYHCSTDVIGDLIPTAWSTSVGAKAKSVFGG